MFRKGCLIRFQMKSTILTLRSLTARVHAWICKENSTGNGFLYSIMEPPEKPDESDCCNSGCNPCILDVYEKQLELYKKKIATQYIKPGSNAISQTKYNQFQVTEILKVCPDHLQITFKSLTTEADLNFTAGQHFILKGPTTTRPYTPLKYFHIKPFHFTIIVKLYPEGILSEYIKYLKIDDLTHWRGPHGDFQHIPNKTKEILMLGQGTGVAPLYSVAEEILQNELDDTKIKMVCCFSNNDAILLRERFYDMKSFWNFSYVMYLGQDLHNGGFKEKYGEVINYKRLQAEDVILLLENNLTTTSSILVLICGGESFSNQFKSVVLNCGVAENDVFIF